MLGFLQEEINPKVTRLRDVMDGVNEEKQYSFVESCFGGNLIIVNGYSYRRKSKTVGKSYWCCCTPKCPAKGIMPANGNFRETNSQHNHEPDSDCVKRKEKLVELKKLALKVNTSGKKLLEALDIKSDVEKHLSFIRTCRRRKKNRDKRKYVTSDPSSLRVGLNYKRLPARNSSNVLIFHSGYIYRQDSVNHLNPKRGYWRCRVKNCKARAVTDDAGNLIISKPVHNHPFDKSPGLSQQPRDPCKTKDSTIRKLKISEEDGIQTAINDPNDDSDGESICADETNPVTESETFNFEKLMEETLADSYCVSPEIGESILLKSE